MEYTWTEVAERGLLSDAVINDIPQYCDCGAEHHITDNLTNVFCPRRECFYKIAARLENMAKAMQVDGWGASTCIELVQRYGLVSPYQALLANKLIERGEDTGIANFPNKVRDLRAKAQEPVELWKVVQFGSLPGIDTAAQKLFSGYKTVEDFYNDFENAGYADEFVARRLGSKSVGARAGEIADALADAKDELLLAEKLFNIQEKTGEELHICITGGVHGFKNKPAFIEYINETFEGKVNAIWAKSMSSDVDILVCDGDGGSNKYRTAAGMNAKAEEKAVKAGLGDRIGELAEGDLHSIGEAVFIGTAEQVIERIHNAFD